jgi:hypothetical protein
LARAAAARQAFEEKEYNKKAEDAALRTTSRALMEMERRAKAYPSVAVGAALPPP